MRDVTILKKATFDINNDETITNSEKKKRIKKIEEVVSEKNLKKRYSKLYDMICDYLDKEFQDKNICGFKDNLCSRRRDMIEKGIIKDTYINGCCHGYKENADCEHLGKKGCTIKNIACKMFVCPYLRKKGVHYSFKDIYFVKYFFNTRQKFYMKHTFFVDKSVVLEGILERM